MCPVNEKQTRINTALATAAASSASAMTGSAPISFNAGVLMVRGAYACKHTAISLRVYVPAN
jgi:hypothetical protein